MFGRIVRTGEGVGVRFTGKACEFDPVALGLLQSGPTLRAEGV